jgi:hypothetical protein
MNKKIVLTVLSVAVLGSAVFGVTRVGAQNTVTDPHDSLIQRLVAKFGLNESEVKQVFDEEREARHTEMKKQFEDTLTQAVTDGKITDEQKQKILVKHEEMKAAREADMESFNAMTDDQRKSAMEAKREELKTWAEENDIPTEYFMMRKGGMHRGF